MQKMETHQDDTTTFEVTVTSDGVSTSGISSPQIVLDTHNTLSWGINECSSSFQSVSSCETLESYEPNVVNTESPQVIVVPFLTDNESSGTVLANNGVHIPVIKECSIRIDQLKMTPTDCDETNVEKVIELPFSTNCPTESKNQSFCLSDDDESSVFEGFGLECIIGAEYEMYKSAVSSMRKNAAPVVRNQRDRLSNEAVPTVRSSSEVIVIDRRANEAERHLTERQPPERSVKPETVKRPRQIQRKVPKPQLSDSQGEPINQSRVGNAEADVPISKPNNAAKPVVPAPDRIPSMPVPNVEIKSNKKDSSSDSSDSDSDVIVAPVDEPATKSKVEQSAEIRNNSKQKELRRMEKMRRRKELSLVAERIRDHWLETIAAARKQRKKERKSKMESGKSKHYNSKNDGQHHKQGKRKRISCSSDSDSTDSSSSSRTSSSSSDSESNESDTTRASDTSYTSQTSHTRTESDSSDTDSSDVYRRYRHRLNKYRRRCPSSDTSETSSSDDDDDYHTHDRGRKFHSLQKAMHRKQSRSKSDENCTRSRKRKTSEPHRSKDVPLRKKRKMTKTVHRDQEEDSKGPKSRTVFSQKQQKSHLPSRSSAVKVKKNRPEYAKRRSRIESTSAGDFSVMRCGFE